MMQSPTSEFARRTRLKDARSWTTAALLLAALLATLNGAAIPARADQPVTSPKEFLGHDLGDDYYLANYQDLMKYWAKLDEESDRLRVVSIGTTAEGRRQLMGIVTSAENQKKLDHYRDIAKRMAYAEGIDEAAARALAAEGKSVVWIDGGLHASEVLCAQALMETMYRYLRDDDPETLRILDDVIILFVHANPDGMDLCADWYMRNEDPERRSLAGLPRLYQKYIGHDNNRDFFANTQAETRNMNYTMYLEWLPQIVYNHHQTGPSGTVLFCPPFRDPFNYNVDPLVINGIDSVSAAMMQQFLVEGKPGATCRSGSSYSTWWNGGLRTTAYFHNMIGLLTETIGNPTPTRINFNPAQQLPKADYLAPIEPQVWHFRQSVEYSVSANRGVLDYASRHREELLFNIWHMGHTAIERGNRDSWTVTPNWVRELQANNRGGNGGRGGDNGGDAGGDNGGDNGFVALQDQQQGQRGGRGQARGAQGRGGRGGAQPGGRGGRGRGLTEADFQRMFRDPARRDPRGFIISANQTDFLTATKFVNILLGTGVTVHQATAEFEVGGKSYPAGSYVVKTAQAFRAHVMDMFEPQDHPDDFAYPGAPPTAPYDIAGWTLAYSMGVDFDRVLEGFDGPFQKIEALAPTPSGSVANADGAASFYFDTRVNDSFRAVNRLLAEGQEVHRLQAAEKVGDVEYPAGTFVVMNGEGTAAQLGRISQELGVSFTGSSAAPSGKTQQLQVQRIGLWDRAGGSMPSGWTRWILEQFEYPFEVVYADDVNADDLRSRFDVLIFVDGALGGGGGRGGRGGRGGAQGDAEQNSGNSQADRLRTFMEAGGTVLTIGSSTRVGNQLNLPFGNHLTQTDENGEERTLGRNDFYIPGSLLRVRVDNSQPLAWGLGEEIDVMFSNGSPTFKLNAGNDSQESRLTSIAWFENDKPLRSGWAWGQENLNGGVSIIEADFGPGYLAMFGPEILFRGQPHGTFKFLFNGIVNSQGPSGQPADRPQN